MSGPLADALLIAVWAGAVAGIVVELIWVDAPKWVSTIVYLGVGWIGLLGFPAIVVDAGVGAGVLIAVGGVLYTAGAVIYARAAAGPEPGGVRLPRDLPRPRHRRRRRALRGDRDLRAAARAERPGSVSGA